LKGGIEADANIFTADSPLVSYSRKESPSAPTSIYSTHAYPRISNTLTYTILVSALEKDTYDVALYWAENSPNAFGKGKRVFNVFINGESIEEKLDVFEKEGAYKPYYLEKTSIKAPKGTVVVKLVGLIGSPFISGISVTNSNGELGDVVQEGASKTNSLPQEEKKPAIVAQPPTEPKKKPVLVGPPPTKPTKKPDISAPSKATEVISANKKTSRYSVKFTQLSDKYPIRVFEAGGCVLGKGADKYLVVFGGFRGFPDVTNAVYERKLTSSSSKWVKKKGLGSPISTHMAQAVYVDNSGSSNGDTIFLVGGFDGKHPGMSINNAFSYNRRTNRYSKLPNLPANRAGGGLALVNGDTLLFAGGVDRPKMAFENHRDHGTTWTLNFKKPGAKWTRMADDMPSPRNHMAAVNVCGRILFVGGQRKVDEKMGNSVVVSEWLPKLQRWSKNPPAPLPFPLGHVSASVMAYKCGLIVVGGITTGRTLSNKVLHWNSASDKWSTIGIYPHRVSTPVCGIVGNELMCATGGDPVSRNLVYYANINQLS